MSAIFLDLSRMNHSCLPNAAYEPNTSYETMELYSTHPVRAGEEVTIDYGDGFQYMTGVERNALLRYTYGFTCTCKACTDPSFAPLSDRRRQMLKHDHYCGMLGHRQAPDFSPQALGIDGPSSVRPVGLQFIDAGYPDGLQIFRLGTVELMRRQLKLKYDEGLVGKSLISELHIYAGTAILVMEQRMAEKRSSRPVDLLADVGTRMQLLIGGLVLMKSLKPDGGSEMLKQQEEYTKTILKSWNLWVLEELTLEQSKEVIEKIMSEEPDPFSNSPAWSRRN